MMPRNVGGLLTTEVEYVDLGQYDGRRLRGRVEHRRLRLGSSTRFRVSIGRVCPTAIEVVGEDGGHYSLTVRPAADPAVRAIGGVALLVFGTLVLPRLLARLRHTRK